MERFQLKPFSDEERADLAIRILHPTMAAEKLGLTVAAVMRRRTELGLPAVEEQFRKWGNSQSNGSAKRKPR
jgi:hypothetical protein